jgi:hypothetical protein
LKALKPILILAIGLFALISAKQSRAESGKMDLAVECPCTDRVGEQLCADFKSKVAASPGYHLAFFSTAPFSVGGWISRGTNIGYGVGLHFSCVDLWSGLENGLAGQMSAVSVAFTVYSDKLPGEIYLDSSVSRVGKDAADEMSRKIISFIGQVSANESLFQNLRRAEQNPAPSPSP